MDPNTSMHLYTSISKSIDAMLMSIYLCMERVSILNHISAQNISVFDTLRKEGTFMYMELYLLVLRKTKAHL